MIECETPNGDNMEEEKNKEFVYELNYDNKKYNFTLSLIESNSLILKIKENNNNNSEEYKNQCNLNDLKKINKIFKLYDNEVEVFNALNNILNEKQASIQKIKDYFSINFLFGLPGNKKKEIIIPLYKSGVEKNCINDEYIAKINDLENRLNKEIKEKEEYKKIIEDNKKSILDFKTNIIELNEKIKNLKEEIIELKNWNKKEEENKKFLEIIKDSNILQELQEFQLINNRLKEYSNNKEIKYKLLYRASTDGDKAKIFHEKCNGIKGTLSLVKTTELFKFGGYTEALWDGNDFKKDEKAFCFSLTLNIIYNVSIPENAIRTSETLGPRFANTLFGIEDEAFNKGEKGGWSSYYSSSKDYGNMSYLELTGGQKAFGVSEVEVFQVIFQ